MRVDATTNNTLRLLEANEEEEGDLEKRFTPTSPLPICWTLRSTHQDSGDGLIPLSNNKDRLPPHPPLPLLNQPVVLSARPSSVSPRWITLRRVFNLSGLLSTIAMTAANLGIANSSTQAEREREVSSSLILDNFCCFPTC